MKYEEFTREQVVFLTFVGGCGNMAFNFMWSIYISGRSGWIASAIGILLVIPFVLAILHICKSYPKFTIFDVIEGGLGKPVYMITVLLYSLVTVALGVFMINMFSLTIRIFFLQLTPEWVVMLFIMLVSVLFVNNRTLLFGRVVELLTVWYIINYFTGFSLAFASGFTIENITPIFDTTLFKFGEGVFFSLGSASEITLLVMVMAGHIPDPYRHRRWVIWGIALWAFIISLAIFMMQGLSSPEILLRIAAAGVGSVRAIFIGDFVRGLEVFILATYQLITILKISVYLYGIWIPVKKHFNEKYSTFTLILRAISILIPSIWLNSYNDAFFFSIFIDYYILLPLIALIIITAALSTVIMRKKHGSDAD